MCESDCQLYPQSDQTYLDTENLTSHITVVHAPAGVNSPSLNRELHCMKHKHLMPSGFVGTCFPKSSLTIMGKQLFGSNSIDYEKVMESVVNLQQ